MKLSPLMIALAALCASSTTLAETVLYQGIDIAPMVSFYRSQIKEIAQPMMIYHWAGDRQTMKNPTDVNVRSLSRSFWNHYGDPKSAGPMYGHGLYGAIDPVLTRGYGGTGEYSKPVWQLLEMKLPVGFRMMDFSLGADIAIPQDVREIANKFSCPLSPNADAYFVEGGTKLNATCRGLTKNIFKDILEIDGIAYNYGGTAFKSCVENRMLAFVIVNDSWVESDLIHFYNSDSKENLQNRILIQTLFLEASLLGRYDEVALEDMAGDAIEEYLTQKPDREFKSSQSLCAGATCRLIARFCNDANQCDEITVASLPRPGGALISAADAGRTEDKDLLWKDLEGQTKPTTTADWLKLNKFGCSGKSPYKQ